MACDLDLTQSATFGHILGSVSDRGAIVLMKQDRGRERARERDGGTKTVGWDFSTPCCLRGLVPGIVLLKLIYCNTSLSSYSDLSTVVYSI